MLRLARRLSPRNPFAAVLFWAALVVTGLVALFTAFYLLDGYLPGAGML